MGKTVRAAPLERALFKGPFEPVRRRNGRARFNHSAAMRRQLTSDDCIQPRIVGIRKLDRRGFGPVVATDGDWGLDTRGMYRRRTCRGFKPNASCWDRYTLRCIRAFGYRSPRFAGSWSVLDRRAAFRPSFDYFQRRLKRCSGARFPPSWTLVENTEEETYDCSESAAAAGCLS